MAPQHDNDKKSPPLLQLIGSVLAALLGVQSNKNRQRDFRAGDAKSYIVIGIVATLLLVAGLIAIVNLVLP